MQKNARLATQPDVGSKPVEGQKSAVKRKDDIAAA
jgi:hypothetical protein